MVDFSLRVGFEMRLCPALTRAGGERDQVREKQPVPSRRVTDSVALNRQAMVWCDSVAHRQVHGTTHRIPWEMLAAERPQMGSCRTRSPYRNRWSSKRQGIPCSAESLLASAVPKLVNRFVNPFDFIGLDLFINQLPIRVWIHSNLHYITLNWSLY